MMTLHKLIDPQRLHATLLGIALLLLHPGITSATEQQQDNVSLVRGATSWAQNCARCHNMRDTSEFNDTQWKVITNHMRVRAGLTGQEARDIIRFLQENN